MNRASIENIRIAFVAIKSQKLRSILTAFIIAIGITALVGILTAIDALKYSISQQFSSMGASGFTITNTDNRNKRKNGKKTAPTRDIDYIQAVAFKSKFDFPATVSISTVANNGTVVSYKDVESNPNISVMGIDNTYLAIKGLDIDQGRNISLNEVNSGDMVVVIGSEIADEIFEDTPAIGRFMEIGNIKFRVIGTLKEKGSAMGSSGVDRNVLIPIPTARQYFGYSDMPFTIHVMATRSDQLDIAINEATGLFRIIRKDPLGNSLSFKITASDSLAKSLIENLSFVSTLTTIIGLITLLGAAVGLMNIMLVSVTERTKEIGIRKALGASSTTVRRQFLTEAILLCQFGGFVGIILGIGIGNIVAMFVDVSFVIPWLWIIIAIFITFLTGITAGYYPAKRASKMDPIESLRYE